MAVSNQALLRPGARMEIRNCPQISAHPTCRIRKGEALARWHCFRKGPSKAATTAGLSVQWRTGTDRAANYSSLSRMNLPDISRQKSWLQGRVLKSAGVMRHRTEETRWRACAATPDDEPSTLQEEEVTLPDTDEVRETVAIRLPGRRSLQIQFTCNACGTRSTRLLNPFAFTRGTVFVQCAGCEKYHQLVDNLGLIKEYNLKEEREKDALAANGQNEDTPSESL